MSTNEEMEKLEIYGQMIYNKSYTDMDILSHNKLKNGDL